MDRYCVIQSYEVSWVIKSIETEGEIVVTRGWGPQEGGITAEQSSVVRVIVRQDKIGPGNGWWRTICLKMVKMVNFTLSILYHNKTTAGKNLMELLAMNMTMSD